MSLTTGQSLLEKRLQSMPDRPPLVYDDDPNGADLPRIVVQNAGGSQQTVFRNKGMTDARPEIIVRVETQRGDYGVQNRAIVQKIMDHFPIGAKFDGISINDAPMPRGPISGVDVYSVPVIIRGRFFF